MECGARRGPLPRPVAEMLGAMVEQGKAPAPVPWPAEWVFQPPRLPFGIQFPSPRAASIAVMGMLAFGVILGSTASPDFASLPAASPLLLAVRPHASPLAGLAGAAAGSIASSLGADNGGGGGGTTTVVITETTPAPSDSPSSAGTGSSSSSGGGGGGSSSGAGGSGAPGSRYGIPPVHHLFLIMLSDQGFEQAFGPASTDTYLSQTLPATGELIPNFYAVAGGELANEIALLSGQGPTAQTEADCPTFAALAQGKVAKNGQVLGDGCVYPKSTATLMSELTAAGYSWKAYVGGIDLGPPGQPTACRHPKLGAVDADHAPRPGDAYVTWLNPFVYFGSVIESKACATDDVGIGGLAGGDLDNPKTAPTVAYIVPSPCDDASAQPCAPGVTAGLPAADSFLQTVIPEIEQSAAYKDNGLIAITFDQAPQTGEYADSRACCEYPAYPNLARAARDRKAADTTTTTSTAPTTTSTTPTATTTTATTTPATSSTTPTTTSATPTTSTTTPAATPTPTFPVIPGQNRATGGGGQVGLLLISRYVEKGSVDATDYFNDYSLLATIEDMFGLKPLGYAADKSLPILGAAVFDGQSG